MDEVEAADLKTLALSRPPLTEATLRELMAYQRAVIVSCVAGPRDLAAARQAAMKETRLSPDAVEQWSSVVREYCGKRWTARVLERRRQELEARGAQGALPPGDEAKLAALRKEGARVADLTAMRVRYGAAAFALLEANEDALLALHERLRALSCF